MGYQIYWANGRWQGYGVPAYCDYENCKEEIDRGLAYRHENENDDETPRIFVCNKHKLASLNKIKIDFEKEHPEWLSHILTHGSWKQWRSENPEIVKKYKLLLLKEVDND